MRGIIYTLMLVILLINQVYSQKYSWSKVTIDSYGGSCNWGGGQTVGKDEYIYAVGAFNYTCDFDPSPKILNLTASGNSNDAFISKYDSSGKLIWVKPYGGINGENGANIVSDSKGFLYVVGKFFGITDLDPGPAIFYASTITPTYENTYISKFDTAGNLIWAKVFSGDRASFVSDIKVDDDDHVLIAGSFYSTIDLDPGPAKLQVTSKSDHDLFMVRLTPEGNLSWAKTISGPGNTYSSKTFSVANGSIVIGGNFIDSLDVDPGPSTHYIKSTHSNSLFFASYDVKTGDLRWARVLESRKIISLYDIVTDHAGNVILNGQYKDFIDVDPGPKSVFLVGSNSEFNSFVVKYDQEGNYLFSFAFEHYQGCVSNVETDKYNNIYVQGNYRRNMQFETLDGILKQYTAKGKNDLYFCKFSPNGTLDWIKNEPGNFHYGTAGHDIDISQSGNIYLSGLYSDTIYFHADDGTPFGLYTSGGRCAYLVRYSGEIDSKITDTIPKQNSNGRVSAMFFPMPTNDILNIQLSDEVIDLKGTLTDVAGRTVLSFITSGDKFMISLGHLAEGIYFLHLEGPLLDETSPIPVFK